MNMYSTTVRMLRSGLVIHDYVSGSDVGALQQRHQQLVAEMTGMVRGTQSQVREQRRILSTIFVGERALIEVTTS